MSVSSRPLALSYHEDPPRDWDDFIMACEPSHFEQTSWWANVESGDGWFARYIAGRRDGRLVAGAMALVRRQGQIGKVGYVYRGPLIRADIAAAGPVRTTLSEALKELARRERLVLLVVVPPYGGDEMALELLGRGFLKHLPALPPSGLPTGTVTIDLRPGLEAVERGYRHTLRKQIRRAESKGVEVSLGSAEDLEIFWTRHQELCRRRGVTSNVPGPGYVRRVWDEFHRHGRAWMFNAALGGEVRCSRICLGAGKWFFAWRVGSAPDLEKAYPTQAALARAIATAVEAGYHFFDLLGIDWDEAVRIERGEAGFQVRVRELATRTERVGSLDSAETLLTPRAL